METPKYVGCITGGQEKLEIYEKINEYLIEIAIEIEPDEKKGQGTAKSDMTILQK